MPPCNAVACSGLACMTDAGRNGYNAQPLTCPCLLLQIGTLTLRKLRDLEKESGMTGSKEGGSSRKAEPKEEVRPWQPRSPMFGNSYSCAKHVLTCAYMILPSPMDGSAA